MIVIRLLFWLDGKILAAIEKFAHWFQEMTGKTNYFLIGFVALIKLGFVLMILWSGVGRLPPENLVIGDCLMIAKKHWLWTIVIATGLLFESLFSWQLDEVKSFKRLEQGLANPKKKSVPQIIWRLANLSMVGGFCGWSFLSDRQYLIFFVCMFIWIGLYLEACDPLPPCRGKIGEFLQSLFLKPAYENASDE